MNINLQQENQKRLLVKNIYDEQNKLLINNSLDILPCIEDVQLSILNYRWFDETGKQIFIQGDLRYAFHGLKPYPYVLGINSNISKLIETSGIYFITDKNFVVYIGMTLNFKVRFTNYNDKNNTIIHHDILNKISDNWLNGFGVVYFFPINADKEQLLELELFFIKKYAPILNKQNNKGILKLYKVINFSSKIHDRTFSNIKSKYNIFTYGSYHTPLVGEMLLVDTPNGVNDDLIEITKVDEINKTIDLEVQPQ